MTEKKKGGKNALPSANRVMGKGGQRVPESNDKKPLSNAAGRKRSGVGGHPNLDDSGIIDSVGMLIAENRWLRERGSSVPELDTTNAIRRAVEQTYQVWRDAGNEKDDAINKALKRLAPKLKNRGADGKTVLDDAIARAANQKTIFRTPITRTLLCTPLPPAMNADTALIHEFIVAVANLAEWSKDLSRSTYTVLDNKTRSDLKRFLACFKKIEK